MRGRVLGLLVGAVLNVAPHLFAGVLAQVPFVDPLTTILDPSLPLTVTEWDEWGNPLEDRDVYEYMKSYSPYENVGPQDYPAVLAMTSLNDTRVYYVEPAKWVAALRHAQHDPVADGRLGADGERESGVRVQHAAILHIRPRTDHDGLVVAAGNGAEPDAGILPDDDPADQYRRIGHPEPAVVRNRDPMTVKLVERHQRHSPRPESTRAGSRFLEVHLEDGHLELVAQLAILVLARQGADARQHQRLQVIWSNGLMQHGDSIAL